MNSHDAGKKKKPSVLKAVQRANWDARKEQGFAGLPGRGGKHHTRDYDAEKGRGGKPPKHKQDWSAERYAEEPTLTQPLMTRPDYGTAGDSKMATDLRSKLIRLAHANPALRADILPLLAPGVDVRLASLRVKLSHRPQLEREGLNSTAAKQGVGAMLYFIDSAKNHSKYYEMIIKPEDEHGMFVLKKRWGALTDKGDTGRGDEKVEMFPSLAKAKAVLAKTYREKTNKGYKDAFNQMMHVSPATGETLPLGQYPVGLTREVGFGWGTQSATKCIPSLRDLQEKIDGALGTIEEVKAPDHSDLADILADLQGADRIINGLMRNKEAIDDTNQSMGDILANMIRTPIKRINALMGTLDRAQVGRPVVLDRQNLREELVAIRNYIRKQLSHCA
jgi:predicted DNA-binding WGR domain protein